jgi:hypothetical protein
LIRALEEITTRAAGAEDLQPYPGLASFTEEDAAYFFGREVEVEEVWKKLRRPHLLALIGPSGAGKTSFLQAGLLAAMPAGWQAVRCTPGSRPFKTLAQALASDLAGDAEAMRLLVDAEDLDAAVALMRWSSWTSSRSYSRCTRRRCRIVSPSCSGGWLSRPMSTCCCRCGTTFCSTARITALSRRSSPS